LEGYKTIKELADEIGVSKTAINKKVEASNNENLKKNHFSKNGNKFLIDEIGQDIIRSMFFDNDELNRKPNVFENENQEVGEVFDLITFLKGRLLVADKQNEAQSKQIDDLKVLLDQQQQLTLQSNKQIEQLQQQLVLTMQKQETEVEQNEERNDLNEELERAENSKMDLQPLDKKWWQFWK